MGKGKKKGDGVMKGRTLLDMMWEDLDRVVDRLMSGPGSEAADGRDPGRAEGIALCIAVVTTPYAPDIEAIRTEAMQRWEEGNGA